MNKKPRIVTMKQNMSLDYIIDLNRHDELCTKEIEKNPTPGKADGGYE